MIRRTGWIVATILAIATFPAAAQWLNVPTKGIPRTKDGKPDLTAPAPRRPDGQPDLTGVWMGANDRYLLNLAADFKPGELPIQPWAEALTKQRTEEHGKEFPPAYCLPAGIAIEDTQPFYPRKIIQEPDLVVILNEARGSFRQIFLDGRIPPTDPNPTWTGYSVGHWEGDTLVVDSRGFNGKTWLDVFTTGHPTTDALHVIERFRRRDFGHMDIQITIDDPKAYTKPWTVTVPIRLLADTDLLEYVCENNKDVSHMVGK
jgi:hypothetical protein